MKSNVDLTQDRMFTPGISGGRWRRTLREIRSAINTLENITVSNDFSSRAPWNGLDKWTWITHRLIPTGNKENRKLYKQIHSIEDGYHCECCGKELREINYFNESILCKTCRNISNQNIDKCPWRRDENINFIRDSIMEE